MTLGGRIKVARRRLEPRLTQKQIAAEFGITEQAVSAWERDEGPPDLEKLARLRRILRVTYAWLLEGDGPPPEPDAPEVLLEDLPGEQQGAVRAGLKAMLDTLQRGRVA